MPGTAQILNEQLKQHNMSVETISPFANLYLKVMARIKEKVPEVRYIDQDLGQLEHYDIRPAVSFPCVLVDVDSFTFSEAGQIKQIGEGMLIIRLGVPAFSSSNNLAPDAVRLKALEYYLIEEKIHEALHGWSDTGFSRLLRRASKLEERNDPSIRVRVIPYAVSTEQDIKKVSIHSRPEPLVGVLQV